MLQKLIAKFLQKSMIFVDKFKYFTKHLRELLLLSSADVIRIVLLTFKVSLARIFKLESPKHKIAPSPGFNIILCVNKFFFGEASHDI